VTQDEHLLTFDQLRDKHNTNFDTVKPLLSKGLTESDAVARLNANGPNVITPAKTQTSFQLFLHCLTNKFSVLLIFCAILTLILLSLPGSDIRNVSQFPTNHTSLTLVPFSWQSQ